jgi:hypothetical protein
MAVNFNAVRAKLVRRGGGRAVARARRIVSENPTGMVARRLGVDGAGADAATIDPKQPINRAGQKVASEITAQIVEDARPRSATKQDFDAARFPGSPY